MICNILFIDEAHFTSDGINNKRQSHLWQHKSKRTSGKQILTSPFRKRVVWRHWWAAHCTVCIPCGVVSLVSSSLYCLYSVWCGVIGEQLIVSYIFRLVWCHWWAAYCTVHIPLGVVSLVSSSLYCLYSVWRGVIGEQLIVLSVFRVAWRHWWAAHCTVYIPCGVASLVSSSLYRTYSAWCGVVGEQLIVPYIFRLVWRRWWAGHCIVYIPCDVASLVTRSLYLISSRMAWQAIFTPTFCRVWFASPLEKLYTTYSLKLRECSSKKNDVYYTKSTTKKPQFLSGCQLVSNQHFQSLWIGRSGAQNLPPRSPNLRPLN